MGSLSVLIVISVVNILTINVCVDGAKSRFIPDDSDIFSTCDDHRGTNGIHDIVDTSDLKITYSDEMIAVSGSATITWDVEETDRVAVVYNHKEFSAAAETNVDVVEGRYKLVMKLQIFDAKGLPKSNEVCFEVRGEVEKI
uniref:Uncharacterized protein n=1 Tax=Glossina brevipalpis TaxID=37001 RepID=A0A1A9WR59_9MUSC